MANSTIEDLPAPSWLIDLEGRLKANNQNRQLGHEVGAGSPCLKCADACPGLELHFWRKLCISCKCKKEDHDIPPDDSVLRFDILLTNSDSKRYKTFQGVLDMHIRRSNLSNVGLRHWNALDKSAPITANEKSTPANVVNDISAPESVIHDPSAPVSKVTFDWVPPDTSNELAALYMSQLPINKLPISGTHGARYRQIQLGKQIPLYDISPEVRHKLTAAEQQGFQSYLEAVRNNVGLGKIQKICQKTFLEESVPHDSFKTPALATGLKKKDDRDDSLKSQINSLVISDESNSPENKIEKLKNIKNLNITPFKPFKQPSTNLEQTSMSNSSNLSALKTPGAVLLPPSAFVPVRPKSKPFPIDPIPHKSESDLSIYNPLTMSKVKSDSNNSNLQHSAPFSTMCPNHERLLNSISNLSTQGENTAANSNLDQYKITDRPNEMEQGARESYDTNSQTQGSKDIPKYDMNVQFGFDSHPQGYKAAGEQQPSVSFEENVGNERQLEMDLRNANDKDMLSVERPLNCWQCQKPLIFGSVAIVADRAGSDKVWHPQCFVCCICQELLVDLVYFYHKEKVYCGRHYAEKRNIMRCYACDELIFVNEFTYTEGKTYHVIHFCCAECDLPLADKKYIMLNDHPNCLDCFDTKHSKACLHCGLPIRAEQQGVKLDKWNWHASPACFKCEGCGKSLLNSKFVLSDNKPYCSKKCVSLS